MKQIIWITFIIMVSQIHTLWDLDFRERIINMLRNPDGFSTEYHVVLKTVQFPIAQSYTGKKAIEENDY